MSFLNQKRPKFIPALLLTGLVCAITLWIHQIETDHPELKSGTNSTV